jgi:NADH-quinone oxidoreductase subunit L
VLAVLAVVGGVLQIPGVTHVIDTFLEPTFEESRFGGLEISSGIEALVLVVSGIGALAGIGAAWFVYVARPGTGPRLARRFARLHGFLEHKWYFDELYDALLVRPTRALGEGASNVFERVVIQGMVGGATVAVRVGSSIVRVAQSGLLRYYALLLLAGVGGLTLYFLVVSR